jgi:hypothetical protein
VYYCKISLTKEWRASYCTLIDCYCDCNCVRQIDGKKTWYCIVLYCSSKKYKEMESKAQSQYVTRSERTAAEALVSCSNGICGVPRGVRSSLSENASAVTFHNDTRGCHFENDVYSRAGRASEPIFFKMPPRRVILKKSRVNPLRVGTRCSDLS